MYILVISNVIMNTCECTHFKTIYFRKHKQKISHSKKTSRETAVHIDPSNLQTLSRKTLDLELCIDN